MDYQKCSLCGCLVEHSRANIGVEKEIYCDDCFNERYFKCEYCGIVAKKNEEHVINRHSYCKTCYDIKIIESAINQYSYRPDGKFFISDKESASSNICKEFEKNSPEELELVYSPNLFMGIELEVQHKDDLKKGLSLFLKKADELGIKKYFYLKSDSSVSNGFEIVTHPLTLKFIKNKLKLHTFLSYLRAIGFTSYKSGACGLHVHVDKGYLTDNEINTINLTKLRIFFATNRKKIEEFSGRQGVGVTYWQFEKCINPKDFLNMPYPSDRHFAVNFQSSRNTVEIRVFRGTLKYRKVLATLQFCDAIVNFVKDVSVVSLIQGDGLYVKNSWKRFLHWCKEKNEYQQFLSYFKSKEMEDTCA